MAGIDVKYDVILNELREEDSGGGGGGTPVNLVKVTYAEAQTAKGASALQEGSFYLLTDKDIIIQATSTNTFSLHGSFIDTSLAPLEVDYIEFDFDNCYITRRRDKRGNDVTQTYQYTGGADYISEFIWGDDRIFGNVVVDTRVRMINGVNTFDGIFSDNNIFGGNNVFIDLLDSTAIVGTHTITGNDIGGNWVFVNPLLSAITLDGNKFGLSGALVYNGQYGNNISFNNIDGTMRIGGVGIRLNLSGATIQWNVVNINSSFSIETLNVNAGTFQNINIEGGSTFFYQNDLASGAPHTMNTISIDNGSFCNVINTRSVNELYIDNSSSFNSTNFQNSNLGIDGVSLTGSSIIDIDNLDGALTRFEDIQVSESSSLTVNGDSGNRILRGWVVNQNAVVSTANVANNAIDVIISGWVVTLFIFAGNTTNGFVSHNNLRLTISSTAHNQVQFRSSLPLFHFYNTKVSGQKIQVTTNSPDQYCGLWFLYGNGISQNPLAPSVIIGFNNDTRLKTFSSITVEIGELPLLPNIAYLKIQKTARVNNSPASIAGQFLMPADLVLEGTGGIFGNGGDSVTFYYQFQRELMQIGSISYR